MIAGRADYFGNLPNLAARLSSMASPGQIILDGHGVGVQDADVAFANPSDSAIMLPPLSGARPAAFAPTLEYLLPSFFLSASAAKMIART